MFVLQEEVVVLQIRVFRMENNAVHGQKQVAELQLIVMFRQEDAELEMCVLQKIYV